MTKNWCLNIDYKRLGFSYNKLDTKGNGFQVFKLISAVKSLKKVWNEQKRLKTAEKKYLDQLSGAVSTWELVEMQGWQWSISNKKGQQRCYSPVMYLVYLHML